MTRTMQPARNFAPLRRRLAQLQRWYNPSGANLHVEALDFGDVDLYPGILLLADDGLKMVKRHDRHFAVNALYDDGMFWYDLFLTIHAAGARVRVDRAGAYIDPKCVDKLLHILTKMSRYSVNAPDSEKRNFEALSITLLSFYSPVRARALREAALRSPPPVKRFLTDVNKRVAEIRRSERNKPEQRIVLSARKKTSDGT